MNNLQKACRSGDFKKVKKLLEEGVDPNCEEALHDACYYGYLKIVKLLLGRMRKPYSEQSIRWAAYGGRPRVVKFLFDSGVDFSNDGGASLHLAASYDYVEVAKILLEHGADPFSNDDEEDKNETLVFMIKYNLMTLEDIQKNMDRIPWDQVYRW
jgi:ankyrin repeat protein